MTSKKKSNSAFGSTFGWGMFFISIVVVILSFFVVGVVNYFVPDNTEKVSSKESLEIVSEETGSADDEQTDTFYITKTVIEKCTKKHCTDEISTAPSPIEEDKQHDSTNN